MGMDAPITAEEHELMNQLRERLSDLEFNSDRFGSGDDLLIRYLRDNKLSLKEAEHHIRKYLKFWENQNLSSIESWRPSEKVQKYLQYELCGIDDSGCPVILLPWGDWNLRKILELGTVDDNFRTTVQLFEVAARKMTQFYNVNGKPSPGLILLCDMTNFSIRNVMSKQAISSCIELTKCLDSYYAINLKLCSFRNATAFSFVWKIVKPFLREQLRKKFYFQPDNESLQETLRQLGISNKFVPTVFGGDYQTSITYYKQEDSTLTSDDN